MKSCMTTISHGDIHPQVTFVSHGLRVNFKYDLNYTHQVCLVNNLGCKIFGRNADYYLSSHFHSSTLSPYNPGISQPSGKSQGITLLAYISWLILSYSQYICDLHPEYLSHLKPIRCKYTPSVQDLFTILMEIRLSQTALRHFACDFSLFDAFSATLNCL